MVNILTTAKRLLKQAKALRPPDRPGAPGDDTESCPACHGPVQSPTAEQWGTLLRRDDADLVSLRDQLGGARHLTCCPACAVIVASGSYDVEAWRDEFWGHAPPSAAFDQHLRHLDLLHRLQPCPYHRWCFSKQGKLCGSCNGLGRLRFLSDEEARDWQPPAGAVASDLPPVPVQEQRQQEELGRPRLLVASLRQPRQRRRTVLGRSLP